MPVLDIKIYQKKNENRDVHLIRRWSLLKLFREENKLTFVKIQLFLKRKLEKNWVELWPTDSVTKKDIFYIFKFVVSKVNIFLLEYVLSF